MNAEGINEMLIPSVASMVGCSTIMLTFCSFDILQTKPYQICIFWIALSLFLSAFGSAFGYPASNTVECWIQGLFTNIFSLSSVMWTTVVAFMLYYLAFTGKIFRIGWKSHLVCWGLPILVTLLPLMHVTYGSDDGDWCWLVETENTPDGMLVIWHWINYYAPLWTCIAMIIFFLVRVSVIRYNSKEGPMRVAFDTILRQLQLYPLVVCISWAFACFTDMYPFDYEGMYELGIFSNVSACLQGFITTCVFWYMNRDIRQLWVECLNTMTCSSLAKFSFTGAMKNAGQRLMSEAPEEICLDVPIYRLGADSSGATHSTGPMHRILKFNMLSVQVGPSSAFIDGVQGPPNSAIEMA